MRIAYVANDYLDPQRPNSWSGLPHFIKRALEHSGVEVVPFVLHEPLKFECMLRYAYWRILRRKRYLHFCEARVLHRYTREIERNLQALRVDAVFCPSSAPIAYLRHSVPTVFWTDACFAGMVNFYESFSNLAFSSVYDGHAAERAALQNCARAIYSSTWAAWTAIENYGAEPSKVRVVPFGGNIVDKPAVSDVARFVAQRERQACDVLLIGVDWERKGVDIAIEAVKRLNQRGLPARLTVVGCTPPRREGLPSFVESIPFIDKSTAEGSKRLGEICRRSHFMIMPSRADCTPVAVIEGNYFGLPCLATEVGGIPSIVCDEVNGRLFGLKDSGDAYAEVMFGLMSNPSRYRALALTAAEYAHQHFSWEASGAKVASILEEVVASRSSPAPSLTMAMGNNR